jgi:hypothetical protein
MRNCRRLRGCPVCFARQAGSRRESRGPHPRPASAPRMRQSF